MKMQKNRAMAATIAILLILTIAIPLAGLQTAVAQNSRPNYAYLGLISNPVGVGQEVLLHIGSPHALQSVEMGWEGLIVYVTKPNGQNVTLGPYKTDSTGGTGAVFVPAEVGNYTLQLYFPEQVTSSEKRGQYMAIGDIVRAGYSPPAYLVVQQEPIPYYPAIPLPTEYWTRPIDAQIREWNVIGGSWLTSTPENKFVPYNEGPESAHILWTKPLTLGGIAGGETGVDAFSAGDAYEGKWTSRFIVSGVVVYNHRTSIRPLEYEAYDVRTGEHLWTTTFLDNRTISMGQILRWEGYNHHGVYSYLWVTVGSTWYAFDPLTAEWVFTVENVPSGSTVVDPENGWIYRYSYSSSGHLLRIWNMTAFGTWSGSGYRAGGSWAANTHYRTLDAGGWTGTSNAQQMAYINVTTPAGTLPGSIQRLWIGDRAVGAQLSRTAVRLWAFSLKPGSEGQLLYNETYTPPKYWEDDLVTVSGFGGGWMAWSQEDYVGVLLVKETREHFGFDLTTGKYLWGPSEPTPYLDSVDDSASDVRIIAFGKLYTASLGGVAHCFDVRTGELLWTYDARQAYTEYLFGTSWWLKPLFATDGKVYFGHTEHSPMNPRPRGAPFICLNATTGEEIWSADGLFRQTRWGGRGIIGDSVIVTMDTYDQRIYAVGKGPSATTAMIRSDILTLGSSVLIQGYVMDVSPGTEDYAIRARFPNGVPAVADESMSDWMLHVYKQFPHGDIVGVPVYVHVLDENGNYRNIGETTTDPNGFFSLNWNPDIPGKYSVIVSFAGSKAYYPSYAYTAFYVDEAPLAEPTPEPLQLPPTEMYILYATIAIIVTIVIIGVVIMMMLRKK